MTEDEAKTKWCPFVRYSSAFDDYAANRWKQSTPPDEPHATNPVPCRCIGSACMAWRWDKELWQLRHDEKGIHLRPSSEPHGYCGLAGKP